MKLLVVQETDWIERGPHQQHHLFERLAERGHEVRVVDFEYLWRDDDSTAYHRGRQVRQPEGHVVDDVDISLVRPPLVRLPVLDKATIPVTHGLELRRQFSDFEPDVVIAFGIMNAFIAQRLAKMYSVPFIYYLIDHLHTLLENRVLEPLAKQVEGRTLAAADHVFVINDGLREYAVSLGADPSDIRVIPGGVDVARYRTADGTGVTLPGAVDEDDVVLFFMGWLYEFSGLRELASSLASYEGDGPRYRLLVVGNGDLFDELAEMRESVLGDDLLLAGRVPFETIPDYLAYANVCLLPAEHNEIMDDIVPIKMYEYLASGCPVVATRLPGIEKEFGEGNGVVYTDGPEHAFERIRRLVESEGLAAHEAAARAFVENYDWQVLVDRFESELESITVPR